MTQRATLQGWLRKQKTPVALAKRARAIVLLADGQTFAATARHVELRERHSVNGRCVLSRLALTVCTTKNAPAAGRFFPPEMALYVVKLACCQRWPKTAVNRAGWKCRV